MTKELKITLKRSPIGRPEKHRRILVSLKLTKTYKSIRVKDTPGIRGMIKKLPHLVEVEEIN